ncbi:hypothetical protein [Ideonella sp.]|uniref:hypothetical protein n=1 Tax=Ideonella sp. TaxID=1929293 RepID=UPI0035B35EC6
MEFPRDVAAVRLDNALLLFDEFVRSTVKHPDAATLRGLERRFAERLQIQPSYWSQIKGRSRQIGERLARQFEQCCHKPYGWMDQPQGGGRAALGAAAAPEASSDAPLPQDDDERFIVGLVLTYYRRHPQRARTRLLDLLGEVLMPVAAPAAPAAPLAPPAPVAAPTMVAPGVLRPAKPAPATVPADDVHSLWLKTQSGVAPLKKKR